MSSVAPATPREPPGADDLDTITDEELLRQLWQSAEDFGERRRIRARMYRLREQRLREMVQNDEENLGVLITADEDMPLKASEAELECSATARKAPNIEVKMQMRSDAAVTDTVEIQNVRLGELTLRGSAGTNKCGASDEDIIDERIKAASQDRTNRYREILEQRGQEEADSAIVSVSKSTYSIRSNALAGDSYQSIKKKEVRDSVSPARGAYGSGAEDSEERIPSDDEAQLRAESDNLVRVIRTSQDAVSRHSEIPRRKGTYKQIIESKLGTESEKTISEESDRLSTSPTTRRLATDGSHRTMIPRRTPSPAKELVSTQTKTGSKIGKEASSQVKNIRSANPYQVLKSPSEEFSKLDHYISKSDSDDEIIKEVEEEDTDASGNVVKMVVQTRKKNDGTEFTRRHIVRSTRVVDSEADINELLVGNPDDEVIKRFVREEEEPDGSKIKVITETRRRSDGVEYETKNVLRLTKIYDFDDHGDVEYSEEDELLETSEGIEYESDGSEIKTVTELRKKPDGLQYKTKRVYRTSRKGSKISPSPEDEVLDTKVTEDTDEEGNRICTTTEIRRTKTGEEYTHRQVFRTRSMTLSGVELQEGLPVMKTDDEVIAKYEKEETDEYGAPIKIVKETRKRKDGSTYIFEYISRQFRGREEDLKNMPMSLKSYTDIDVSEDDEIIKQDMKEEKQDDGSIKRTIVERRKAKAGSEYLRQKIVIIPKAPLPPLEVGSLDDEILEEKVNEEVLDDGTQLKAIIERRRSSTTGLQYTLRRMSKVFHHFSSHIEDEILDENVAEEETDDGTVIRTVIVRYQRPDGTIYTTHNVLKTYSHPSKPIIKRDEDELVDSSYEVRDTPDGYFVRTVHETRRREDGTHYAVDITEKSTDSTALAGMTIDNTTDEIVSQAVSEEISEDGHVIKTITEIRRRWDGSEYTTKTVIKSVKLLVPQHETSYIVIKADVRDEEEPDFFPSHDDDIIYIRKREETDEKGNPVNVIIETRQSKLTGEKYNITKRIRTTDILLTDEGEKILKNTCSSEGHICVNADEAFSGVKKAGKGTGYKAVGSVQSQSTLKGPGAKQERNKRSSSPTFSKRKQGIDMSSKQGVFMSGRSSNPTSSVKLHKDNRTQPLTNGKAKAHLHKYETPKQPLDNWSDKKRTEAQNLEKGNKVDGTASIQKVTPERQKSKGEKNGKSVIKSQPVERSASAAKQGGKGISTNIKECNGKASTTRSEKSSPKQASPPRTESVSHPKILNGVTQTSHQRGRSPIRKSPVRDGETTPSGGRQCCRRMQEANKETSPIKVRSSPVMPRKKIIIESKSTCGTPVANGETSGRAESREKGSPEAEDRVTTKRLSPSETREFTAVSKKSESVVQSEKRKDSPEKKNKVSTSGSAKPKLHTLAAQCQPVVSQPPTPMIVKKQQSIKESPLIEDVSNEPEAVYPSVHRPSIIREPSEYPEEEEVPAGEYVQVEGSQIASTKSDSEKLKSVINKQSFSMKKEVKETKEKNAEVGRQRKKFVEEIPISGVAEGSAVKSYQKESGLSQKQLGRKKSDERCPMKDMQTSKSTDGTTAVEKRKTVLKSKELSGKPGTFTKRNSKEEVKVSDSILRDIIRSSEEAADTSAAYTREIDVSIPRSEALASAVSDIYRIPVEEPLIVPKYIHPRGDEDKKPETLEKLVQDSKDERRHLEDFLDRVSPLREKSPSYERDISGHETSLSKEGSPSRFVTGRPIDQGVNAVKIKRLERTNSNKILYEDLDVPLDKLPEYLHHISTISDSARLEEMLQKAETYEERRVIRSHIRSIKRTPGEMTPKKDAGSCKDTSLAYSRKSKRQEDSHSQKRFPKEPSEKVSLLSRNRKETDKARSDFSVSESEKVTKESSFRTITQQSVSGVENKEQTRTAKKLEKDSSKKTLITESTGHSDSVRKTPEELSTTKKTSLPPSGESTDVKSLDISLQQTDGETLLKDTTGNHLKKEESIKVEEKSVSKSCTARKDAVESSSKETLSLKSAETKSSLKKKGLLQKSAAIDETESKVHAGDVTQSASSKKAQSTTVSKSKSTASKSVVSKGDTKMDKGEPYGEPLRYLKSHYSPSQAQSDVEKIISPYGVGPTDENGVPLFGLCALKRKSKLDKTSSSATSSVEKDIPSGTASATKQDDQGVGMKSATEESEATTTEVSKQSASVSARYETASVSIEESKLERTTAKQERTHTDWESSPGLVRSVRDSLKGKQEGTRPESPADEDVVTQRPRTLKDIIKLHEAIVQDPYEAESSSRSKPQKVLRETFEPSETPEHKIQKTWDPESDLSIRSQPLHSIIARHETIAKGETPPSSPSVAPKPEKKLTGILKKTSTNSMTTIGTDSKIQESSLAEREQELYAAEAMLENLTEDQLAKLCAEFDKTIQEKENVIAEQRAKSTSTKTKSTEKKKTESHKETKLSGKSSVLKKKAHSGAVDVFEVTEKFTDSKGNERRASSDDKSFDVSGSFSSSSSTSSANGSSQSSGKEELEKKRVKKQDKSSEKNGTKKKYSSSKLRKLEIDKASKVRKKQATVKSLVTAKATSQKRENDGKATSVNKDKEQKMSQKTSRLEITKRKVTEHGRGVSSAKDAEEDQMEVVRSSDGIALHAERIKTSVTDHKSKQPTESKCVTSAVRSQKTKLREGTALMDTAVKSVGHGTKPLLESSVENKFPKKRVKEGEEKQGIQESQSRLKDCDPAKSSVTITRLSHDKKTHKGSVTDTSKHKEKARQKKDSAVNLYHTRMECNPSPGKPEKPLSSPVREKPDKQCFRKHCTKHEHVMKGDSSKDTDLISAASVKRSSVSADTAAERIPSVRSKETSIEEEKRDINKRLEKTQSRTEKPKPAIPNKSNFQFEDGIGKSGTVIEKSSKGDMKKATQAATRKTVSEVGARTKFSVKSQQSAFRVKDAVVTEKMGVEKFTADAVVPKKKREEMIVKPSKSISHTAHESVTAVGTSAQKAHSITAHSASKKPILIRRNVRQDISLGAEKAEKQSTDEYKRESNLQYAAEVHTVTPLNTSDEIRNLEGSNHTEVSTAKLQLTEPLLMMETVGKESVTHRLDESKLKSEEDKDTLFEDSQRKKLSQTPSELQQDCTLAFRPRSTSKAGSTRMEETTEKRQVQNDLPEEVKESKRKKQSDTAAINSKSHKVAKALKQQHKLLEATEAKGSFHQRKSLLEKKIQNQQVKDQTKTKKSSKHLVEGHKENARDSKRTNGFHSSSKVLSSSVHSNVPFKGDAKRLSTPERNTSEIEEVLRNSYQYTRCTKRSSVTKEPVSYDYTYSIVEGGGGAGTGNYSIYFGPREKSPGKDIVTFLKEKTPEHLMTEPCCKAVRSWQDLQSQEETGVASKAAYQVSSQVEAKASEIKAVRVEKESDIQSLSTIPQGGIASRTVECVADASFSSRGSSSESEEKLAHTSDVCTTSVHRHCMTRYQKTATGFEEHKDGDYIKNPDGSYSRITAETSQAKGRIPPQLLGPLTSTGVTGGIKLSNGELQEKYNYQVGKSMSDFYKSIEQQQQFLQAVHEEKTSQSSAAYSSVSNISDSEEFQKIDSAVVCETMSSGRDITATEKITEGVVMEESERTGSGTVSAGVGDCHQVEASEQFSSQVKERAELRQEESEERLSSGSATCRQAVWCSEGQHVPDHGMREGRSFLDDRSKVSGITDVLCRMGATKAVDHDKPATDDEGARSLLNKFLGAQVLMSGVESMMASSPVRNDDESASLSHLRQSSAQEKMITSSASKYTTSEDSSSFGLSTRVSSSSTQQTPPVIILGVDISQEKNEVALRKLLDQCEEYEERRQVRQRLKELVADKKALREELGSHKQTSQNSLSRTESENSTNIHSTVTAAGGDALSSEGSSSFSAPSRGIAQAQTSSFAATSSSVKTSSTHKDAKVVTPFEKFRQMDSQQSKTPASASKSVLSGPLFQLSSSLNKSASGVKDVLLTWCQCRTRDYKGVKIENFSTSWNDGIAFCALIHHFYPDAFDFNSLDPRNRRRNFSLAFRVAEERAGVMPLLDVDDMVAMKKPDWKCVFTYIQALYKRLKDE